MKCPKCGNPGGAYSTHVCVSGWVNTSKSWRLALKDFPPHAPRSLKS